jgi:hypothetical protein
MHEFLLARMDASRLVTERDNGDSSEEEDDDDEDAGAGAGAGAEADSAPVGEANVGTGYKDGARGSASGMDMAGGAAVAEGKPGPDADADRAAEDARAPWPGLARLPSRVSGLHQLTRWVDVGDVMAFDRRLAWTGQAAAEMVASKRQRVLPREHIEGIDAPVAPNTSDDINSSSSSSGDDDDDSGSDDDNVDNYADGSGGGKEGPEDKKVETKNESIKEVKKGIGQGRGKEGDSAAVTVSGSTPSKAT